MNIRWGWVFWILLLVLLLVFISAVKSILLPFVVGVLVAYFLDPLADKLEKKKLSRTISTIIITGGFFSCFILIVTLIAPLLFEQIIALVTAIPEYISHLYEDSKPWIDGITSKISDTNMDSAKDSVAAMARESGGLISNLASEIFKSGFGAINILSLMFIAPVVSFYTLRDWDILTAKVDGLIPPKHIETVKKIISEIDEIISGFVRGQTMVCVIMAIYYSVMLSVLGLKFGFIIGLLTGIFTFIPYVGALAGTATGLLVAAFQFGDFKHVFMVLAVFLTGQLLEGTFITPKVVGDKVKLHPVWIIFGLLCGGALFGFVGVLIAVPVTAVIGVLVRFAATQYRNSKIFLGK